MKHIGIFGGTFNPPHMAHTIMAEDVCSQLQLNKMLIMPAALPALKEKPEVSAAQRLEMCRLAFGDNDAFEISDIEINRKGKSYTIDTLIELNRRFKQDTVKLYLIIGIDNLLVLDKWKSPDKLFALAEVVVINRPGFNIKEFDSKYISMVKFLKVPSLEISSSMIRARIKENKSIRYLVNDEVEEYIYKNNLYK